MGSIIEVYEWPEGAARSENSALSLGHIEVTESGNTPQVGDVLFIGNHPPVVVIERTLLWAGSRATDGAAQWGHMWIYARQMPDRSKPASAVVKEFNG